MRGNVEKDRRNGDSRVCHPAVKPRDDSVAIESLPVFCYNGGWNRA